MNLFKEIKEYNKRKEPLWLRILKLKISNFKYECKWDRYFFKKGDILIEKIRKNSKKINFMFRERWKSVFIEINKYKYKNKIIIIYYYKDREYLPLIKISDKE